MGRAGKIILLASTSLILSVQPRAWAQGSYVGPAILPPAPGAIDGGNPFQGLGRSDDPGVSREKQFGFPTYNSSGFNANGMQDRPAPSFYSESYASYPHSDSSTNSSGTSSSSNFPGGFIPTSMLDSPVITPSANSQPVQTGPNGAVGGAGSNFGGQYFAPGFAGQAGFGTTGTGSGIDTQIPGNGSPVFSTNGYNGSNNSNDSSLSNSSYNYNTAAPTQVPVPPSSQTAFTLPASYPVPGSANSQAALLQLPAQNSIQSGMPAISNTPGAAQPNPVTPPSVPGTTSQPSSTEKDQGSIFQNKVNPGGQMQSGSNKQNNANSNSALSLPPGFDSLPRGLELVPPPPPTYFSGGSGIGANPKLPASPLTRAVDQIKIGRLSEALANINNVLRSDPKNANAHYLKAVACVLSRHFDEARTEYLATLKYSNSDELNTRARVGLNKLAH